MITSRAALLLGTALFASMLAAPAFADDPSEIQELKAENQELLKRLEQMQQRIEAVEQKQKQQVAQPQAAPAQPVASAKDSRPGSIHYKGVTLQLGGFFAGETVGRTHNMEQDINTVGSAIPFPNTPTYHQTELRPTARQTRLSLLVGGKDGGSDIGGFVESDFMQIGETSNHGQTSSYVPRLRHAYASYDYNDWGLHVLAGQTYSMLTTDKLGILPRQEALPPTIDSDVHTGFTYDRTAQLRIVKDFDKTVWLGLGLEGAEASVSGGSALASATCSNSTGCWGQLPGGGKYVFTTSGGTTLTGNTLNQLNAQYSLDHIPDITAKAAVDTKFGHFEAFGLTRFFNDRVYPSTGFATGGANVTNESFAGGVGAVVPIVPGTLDFQGNFLAGNGIGRYGPAQLPDAVVNPRTGKLDPIPQINAFGGLIGHPLSSVDVFLLGGFEQQEKTDVTNIAGTNYGYGNPGYANYANCEVEGAGLTPGTTACSPFTKTVWEATIGAWWRFYQGPAGLMQVGFTESYFQRELFPGKNANGIAGTYAPSTNENVVELSFRYYPF